MMKYLVEDVERWAFDNGLMTDIQPNMQLIKLVEELGETARAFAHDDEDALRDGIGDCAVCLIVLAMQTQGRSGAFERCLEQAYNEIRYREGKMKNGLFVKE
tara:strand:- start:47 stop:352 length:306 start_codon:yes stop_codon:yes gene_type:complete